MTEARKRRTIKAPPFRTAWGRENDRACMMGLGEKFAEMMDEANTDPHATYTAMGIYGIASKWLAEGVPIEEVRQRMYDAIDSMIDWELSEGDMDIWVERGT